MGYTYIQNGGRGVEFFHQHTLQKRKKKYPFSQTQIQSHQDLPNCQEESNIL